MRPACLYLTRSCFEPSLREGYGPFIVCIRKTSMGKCLDSRCGPGCLDPSWGEGSRPPTVRLVKRTHHIGSDQSTLVDAKKLKWAGVDRRLTRQSVKKEKGTLGGNIKMRTASTTLFDAKKEKTWAETAAVHPCTEANSLPGLANTLVPGSWGKKGTNRARKLTHKGGFMRCRIRGKKFDLAPGLRLSLSSVCFGFWKGCA